MTVVTAGLNRRTLLQAAAASTLSLPAIGQDMRARTLRMIPSANLSFIDPTISTAGVTLSHGFAVFDCLYGVDAKNQPKPQMVEGHTVSDDSKIWTFTLRPGLKFHDGEPVRGRDCIASIKRWSARDSFGQALATFTDRMDSPDDRTFRIILKRPMGVVLDALAHSGPIPLFILPERLAVTDPFKQVTEMVGSGPYKFLASEFVSGSRITYERNEAYVPRGEPADWTSGGKRAYFDRVEWTVIQDQATAASALAKGEVDWYELALLDLVPQLRKNPNVIVRNRSLHGYGSVARFNFLHPPFNNVAIRRIVRDAVNQVDYMRAIHGDDEEGFAECYAMFLCGLPGVTEYGAATMKGPKDFNKLRADLKAAGYNGEKVVLCVATDVGITKNQGDVTADLLKQIGMNVDYQALDWGTVGQRRASKEPIDKGGWNIFHTWHAGADCVNPAPYVALDASGPTAWFGWPKSDEVQADIAEWYSAPDLAAEKAAAAKINKASMEFVTYLPTGFFKMKQAWRNDLSGVVQAPFPVFWDVKKA